MPTRRSYLAFSTSAAGIILAGCTGNGSDGPAEDGGGGNGEEDDGRNSGDQQGDDSTPEPISVGESVTYGGLEMIVAETQTVDELTTADGSDQGEERDTITPEQGAVFALAFIRITNVGETEIFYPERGGDVQMIYKGEETSNEFVTGPLGINGEMEPVYSDSMDEQGADTGAFPDTVVEGWTVFELPDGFEQSDAFVSIRYSDTSADSRTFQWQFG